MLGCDADSACVSCPGGGCELTCPIDNALCDTVEFPSSGGFWGSPPLSVDNPDAWQCTMAALRDGTPGIVAWDWDQSGTMGQRVTQTRIVITADRRAIVFDTTSTSGGTPGPGVDLDGSSAVGPVVLPASDVFADCMTRSNVEDAFTCIDGAVPRQCNGS